jgi:hypothetical protein
VKKPVGREFRISFDVSGTVEQTVLITDPKMTEGKLDRGLRDGRIATTIQEGGQLIVVKTGRVIGKVLSVENECEYSEFMAELEE